MKILGIDPGFGILGWSVVTEDFKICDYGTIETPPNIPIDERLFIIFTELSAIIKNFRPDCAAIEKLFFSRNTTTALHVAQAIGVIYLIFRKHALIYKEYAPVTVKKSICGYGRATKSQMQFMVQKIYNLKEIPRPDDAADALAIAACHTFLLE